MPPDLLQSLVAALSRDGLLWATTAADGAVRLSLRRIPGSAARLSLPA